VGKSALELREDIVRIRADLDETLDELSDQVRPRRIYERRTRRMRARLGSMREAIMGTAQGAASDTNQGMQQLGHQVAGTAGDVAEKARETPQYVADRTRGNPLAAGLVAFGAGVILGSLAPATSVEQQTVGALDDRLDPLKDKAVESAQQVRADVTEAAREAAQAVRDDAQAAAQEVKSQAQESGAALKPTEGPR
jgi:hypothetical protein